MSILYKDIKDLPNGARFYPADLHLHSRGGSEDVKDPDMTVAGIVEQAYLDRIAILAITDHNTDKNTQESIDYAQKYVGELLVLAAVEVTTAHGHLLVYFSPDQTDALKRFLALLEIKGAGTPNSHTSKSMSDVLAEAMRLGGIGIAAHIDRPKTGFETLADGYPNWKKDIITAPGLVGVEVDDPARLVWYSDNDESTPQGAERKKLLLERSVVPAARARHALAHVQNSDAHTLAAFKEGHQAGRITRLKMDALSFEGFRTALSDPDARVRVVHELPAAVPRVLALHVEGGFLANQTLRVSDNLTCFIGGRGTGKSTALKTLAYALGAHDDLARYDNCPDTVVAYCRDAQGIIYRFERLAGSVEPVVQAAEGGRVLEATRDSFRIEYYGQGDLARVAEDPLRNPERLQSFLDRHIDLSDLFRTEGSLKSQLEANGSRLRPLEAQEATRNPLEIKLKDCDTKLRLAEEGKLKDVAAFQAALGAERSLVQGLEQVTASYRRGVSLRNCLRNYDDLARNLGSVTGDEQAATRLAAIRAIVEDTNSYLLAEEEVITERLGSSALRIDEELNGLRELHRNLEQQVTERLVPLQKAGLSGSLADLMKVVHQRGQFAANRTQLDRDLVELRELREERVAVLVELSEVWETLSRRRRDQISRINAYLVKVIDDYNVVIVYNKNGLTREFFEALLDAMHGSYFPEDLCRRFCAAIAPADFAKLLATGDRAGLARVANVGDEWAGRLIERCGNLATIHRFEVIAKPPCPEIRVVTKGSPARPIPVNQLSDGQRHTIFLTIAMLAESDVPLVIDQPEDDLDNAFVFGTVVQMLRRVKERRQVLLVTHNANIAVLGDAELLFPMRRSGDCGVTFDAGSVDRPETKAAAQAILEGGVLAFLRRKEIYGH